MISGQIAPPLPRGGGGGEVNKGSSGIWSDSILYQNWIILDENNKNTRTK